MRNEEVLALLPAGEWVDVEFLQDRGMMATRGWGRLAKAKSVRSGAIAFLKFIFSPEREHGHETALVASVDRLDSLQRRFETLKSLKSVPTVSIIAVQRLDARCLLLAMEVAEPLASRLSGPDLELAVRVLKDLEGDGDYGRAWIHYDVCPQNIGVLPSGRVVLLDLDALYFHAHEEPLDAGFDGIAVSVPAWKYFRAPRSLGEEVISAWRQGPVPAALLRRKYSFEVVLAAAECIFGSYPVGDRASLEAPAIDEWIAGDDALSSKWRELMLRAAAGLTISISEARAVIEGNAAAPPPRRTAAEAPMERPSGSPSADPFVRVWSGYANRRRSAGKGELTRRELEDYAEDLRRLRGEFPKRAEITRELLLVTLAYKKSLDGAMEAVMAAREQGISDPNLEKLFAMVELWAGRR